MLRALLLASTVLPSCLRIVLYRLLGARIGKRAKLGFGAVVLFKDSLEIGTGTRIATGSIISCNEGAIGANSEIGFATLVKVPKFKLGSDCKISSGAIIRSGHTTRSSEFVAGDLVHIFPFVTIDCSRRVSIGDGTGVGPRCSIFSHSSYKSALQGYPVTYGDVNIGKRVELTYSVFVAPGVTIGDDAICAYGSYVNKDVPVGALAAGLPAAVKRNREQIIAGDIDLKKLINGILEDYRENLVYATGRKPLQTYSFISEEAVIAEDNAVYVILDSAVKSCSAARYGVFDISNQRCFNHELDKNDYTYFRKYLSRYGIRFISTTETQK